MPGLADYLSDYASDFSRGLGVLGHGIKNTVTGQAPIPGPWDVLRAGAENAQAAVSNSPLGLPKAALRAGVGLDPHGSAINDLLNLGVPPALAGGLGAFTDVAGDPALLVGYLPRGAQAVGRTARELAGLDTALTPSRLPKVLAGDKVMGARPAGNFDPDILRAQQKLIRNPDFVPSMQGVEPGATYLGQGAEAVTFKNPAGDVSRIGFPQGVRNPTPPAAPLNIPEINQPTYNQVFGNTRVTRSPFAQHVGTAGDPEAEAAATALRQAIQGRGLDPWDVYGPNVGQVGGQWKVIDQGAVLPQ